MLAKMPHYYKEILKNNDFQLSNWQLIKHIAIDIVLFVAIVASLSSQHVGLYVLAQVAWPILFFRAFGLMHDAVHSAVSKNKFINASVGFLSSTFCFLPYYPWRLTHLDHHYWAGNIEKDPVMKIVRDYKDSDATKNSILTLAWKNWFPLLAVIQHVVFWSAAITHLKTSRKNKTILKCVLSYVIPIAVYATLIYLGIFSLINLLPGLALYLMMVEIINFPHHLQLPQYVGDTRLALWEQHEISRSCYYPDWLSSLILNNFNYHAEHHLFPQLAWYHLGELHKQIKSLQLEGYNYCEGNNWIMENRKKEIGEVIRLRLKEKKSA